MKKAKSLRLPPKLVPVLKATGPRITGPVTDVVMMVEKIEFTGSGAEWSAGEKVITPPTGWRKVSVALAGFNLAYSGEDHEVFQAGALVGITAAPDGKHKLLIRAILRDDNADDARKGNVTVLVHYII